MGGRQLRGCDVLDPSLEGLTAGEFSAGTSGRLSGQELHQLQGSRSLTSWASSPHL